jgi:hypothetical protein
VGVSAIWCVLVTESCQGSRLETVAVRAQFNSSEVVVTQLQYPPRKLVRTVRRRRRLFDLSYRTLFTSSSYVEDGKCFSRTSVAGTRGCMHSLPTTKLSPQPRRAIQIPAHSCTVKTPKDFQLRRRKCHTCAVYKNCPSKGPVCRIIEMPSNLRLEY